MKFEVFAYFLEKNGVCDITWKSTIFIMLSCPPCLWVTVQASQFIDSRGLSSSKVQAWRVGMEMSLGVSSSSFKWRYPRGMVLPLNTSKDAQQANIRGQGKKRLLDSGKTTYNSQGFRAALVSGSVASMGHFTKITRKLGLFHPLLSSCCLYLRQGTLQKVSLL